MLGNSTPKERLGYICLVFLLVSFLCYVGAQQARRPAAPLVIKEETEHRTGEETDSQSNAHKQERVVVHVVGAVKNPGVYTLDSGKRVIDAVNAAGGFAQADETKLNLAAKLIDGTQIAVPTRGRPGMSDSDAITSTPDRAPYLPSLEPSGSKPSSRGSKTPTGVIDLNSASSEQLQTIPGIGPSTAEHILSYRSEHGGFKSVDELTAVGGIGPKKLEKMRKWLRV